MVLSQHRGFRFSFAVDDGANTLNPLRILVTAAALALHAAVLLVLIVPVTMPQMEDTPIIVRTPPDIRKKFEPPPDPPPVPVPVTPPTATPTPVRPVVQEVAVADVPIVSNEGTEPYVEAVAEPGQATPSISETTPVSGVRLEYLAAPPPVYPVAAARAGRQGTVLLQVTVDTDGRPIDVVVYQSSGHRDLDAAARAQVLKRWRFRSAMKDGQAIQAVGMVPVNFTLN